mmetsp:Transcript_4387/g.9164  ORF Transcript_4387/g.9164 Transcript_4387/m.9164 type:complete len:145 (-) Transcript_4387:76-510(-)
MSPKDPNRLDGPFIERVGKAGLGGVVLGTFWGGITTAWTTPPVSDPRGLMPKSTTDFQQLRATVGAQAFKLGTVGVIFAATDCACEVLRDEKVDIVNSFWGGAASGFYLGMRSKRFDIAVVSAVGCGALAAAVDGHGPQWEYQL